ncbi:MAG: chitobiase/beta-hexosaminidase C-terminal domain-containing protein [Bacteroidota bacterium]
MARQLLLTSCLFLALSLNAQVTTFSVTFENDAVNSLPITSPGDGRTPTGLFGNYESTMQVQNLAGQVGQSTASGKVLDVNVPTTGSFQLVEFDGLLNSGIVTEGIVKVSFDFMAHEGSAPDGFAFLRSVDESDESFADIGFSFSETSFNVGLLDFDPATGEYLGWLDPSFPNNSFDLGTWYHFEAIINLDNNTMRLLVDGADYGVVAGISRATGTGYTGAFLNWGTAFQGRCAVDNFRVVIEGDDSLPLPPAGFSELLEVEDHGGTVLRMPCADFRQRGVDWNNSSAAALLLYDSIYQGVSAYRIVVNEEMNEADARLFSFKGLPILPNRTYEVSALIRTDFPRDTWEFNIGVNGIDDTGLISLGSRYGGMPAITEGPDGWQRWTWRITPHWEAFYDKITVFLGAHEYGPGFDGDLTFEIADLAFVELPAIPLEAFPVGEGVSFPGGPGNLPMQIEGLSESGDTLSVLTTGAHFLFRKSANLLEVHQRIDFQRKLTTINNLPLAGLSIQSQSASEVILISDQLTIGVQLDGMLAISPQQTFTATITSDIGGDFNRLSGGDLLSQDDFGGFTANVYTPKGTGVVPQLDLLTPNLDFVGLIGEDLETTGAAASGWQAATTIRPGERLFISAFPSRPYDWERSFAYHWGLTDYNASLDYSGPDYMTTWILWNISQRGWAMSFGEQYNVRENVPYQSHMDAIAAEGDLWSAYFSQWFYYSRNAEEWANEVKRWRDTYGMGAVYSDGMAQDDWLSAYEAMRRLRQDVFPDGDILIHDSYPQSGVAAAAFKPFVYAYATSTYMGENAVSDAGPGWAWARYAMGQYRRSNAFGVTKGDRWEAANGVDKYLIALVWGGRGRPDVIGYESEYLPVLNQLRTLWEQYGDDPYFFDRYYHPEAQILTGFEIGRAGMPIFQLDTISDNNIQLTVTSWTPNTTIRYTTDGTEPTVAATAYIAPLSWDGQQQLRFRAFRSDLDDSRIATIGTGITTSTTTAKHNLQSPALVTAFPNPATSQLTVRYFLPQRERVTFELIDLTGKVVRTTPAQEQVAGYQLVTLDGLEQLPAGVYLVNMRAEGAWVKPLRVVIER